MTADELLRLPRGVKRYELIRGVLVEHPLTGDLAGGVVSLVGYVLGQYVESTGYGGVRLGQPGYLLERNPDTVRAAYATWIAPARVPEGTQGYPELAPDLAVEVKSPSNSNPEMAAKAYMWLSYGSRMALTLDPQHETVIVYRPNAEPVMLASDDVLDGDDVLPGFSCPVRRCFQWGQ